MAEQLVAVAGLGAAPLDQHALAGAHIGAVAALLEIGEEARHRHVERARSALQGRQRRRGAAILDLRQHAGREAGLGGKLGGGELQALAEQPALCGRSRLRAGARRWSAHWSRWRRPRLGRLRMWREDSRGARRSRSQCLGRQSWVHAALQPRMRIRNKVLRWSPSGHLLSAAKLSTDPARRRPRSTLLPAQPGAARRLAEGAGIGAGELAGRGEAGGERHVEHRQRGLAQELARPLQASQR